MKSSRTWQVMMAWRQLAMLAGMALVLADCSNASSRQVSADAIARAGNLQQQDITAGMFTLRSYARLGKAGGPATVYLEGDGFAWADRHTPAIDPTPIEPLGLKLAALDPAANVVYIARPCQYIRSPGCDVKYWTSARLSPEVVNAVEMALDNVKLRGVSAFHLVGYSGGGGLAVLLAARRKDVIDIRTVAGNLDIDRFTAIHHTSPLEGSINPLSAAAADAQVPQRHFAGAQDSVVPVQIAQGFYAASKRSQCVHVHIVENATHTSGWVEHWPEFLSQPVTCTSQP